MLLQDILYSQGFGTRRVCAGLIQQGRVEICESFADQAAKEYSVCTTATTEFDLDQLSLRVQGIEWKFYPKAYILLNKPTGTECSQKPSTYPSVYSLLPSPLRHRPTKSAIQGVQAVGRLDQDTTGMLLLSDDGQFIHRMSSPKKHVAKVYQVTTKHPIDPAQVAKLMAGVVLDDDPVIVKAAACVSVESHRLDLTLTEGKYHQVKRMLAAVGNRVESLHRSRIGNMNLPDDLAPGKWRWLDEADLQLLTMSS